MSLTEEQKRYAGTEVYEYLLAQTKVCNALCNCDNQASQLFAGFHSVDCAYRINQEKRANH